MSPVLTQRNNVFDCRVQGLGKDIYRRLKEEEEIKKRWINSKPEILKFGFQLFSGNISNVFQSKRVNLNIKNMGGGEQG